MESLARASGPRNEFFTRRFLHHIVIPPGRDQWVLLEDAWDNRANDRMVHCHTDQGYVEASGSGARPLVEGRGTRKYATPGNTFGEMQ